MNDCPVIYCNMRCENKQIDNIMKKIYAFVLETYSGFGDDLDSAWWNIHFNLGVYWGPFGKDKLSVPNTFYIGGMNEGENPSASHATVKKERYIRFFLMPDSVTDIDVETRISPNKFSLLVEFIIIRRSKEKTPDISFQRLNKKLFDDGVNKICNGIEEILRSEGAAIL